MHEIACYHSLLGLEYLLAFLPSKWSCRIKRQWQFQFFSPLHLIPCPLTSHDLSCLPSSPSISSFHPSTLALLETLSPSRSIFLSVSLYPSLLTLFSSLLQITSSQCTLFLTRSLAFSSPSTLWIPPPKEFLSHPLDFPHSISFSLSHELTAASVFYCHFFGALCL